MDLLYAVAELMWRFMRASPGVPISLVYIAIAGVPVVLLHELGHAVVARRLLGEDVQVSVGSVGRIAEMRLGGIKVSLNAVLHPARADAHAEFDGSRATADDVAMIALAGPAASLVGAVFTGWLYAGTSPGVMHDFLWAATGAGIFGVLNLVPITFRERRDGPPLRSDGRLLLDALRVARALR